MNKSRIEAFSDGVLAIIITIMVLELKVPQSADGAALLALLPQLFSYMLSFVFLGIYWNNHHHLLQTLRGVNARVMWSNLNLLFWLSLVPFGTGWMGKNHTEPLPVVEYATILLICGYSYDLLRKSIITTYKNETNVKAALEKQRGKAVWSTILYALAIPAAFISTYISIALFVAVALLWITPDKEIEKVMSE